MEELMFISKIIKFCGFGSLIILIFAMSYGADTGKITGKVVDSETNSPLVGVNIIITARWENGQEIDLEEPTGAATDSQGRYFILNLRPGKYSVRAQYMGYTAEVRTQVEVYADKSTRLDFILTPEAIKGKSVTVTAFRKDIVQPDLSATRQNYQIADIQDDIGITDIEDIIDLQSGVVDDHFRGGRSGEAKYLLGGSGIVNPLTNDRAFSPKVAGLQSVDVYTSGFSAEYGNAQSGVVNMVPKEGRTEWKSRLEFNMVLPYYKTFETRFDDDSSAYYRGGSLYSPRNVDFYSILMDTTEWLKDDPFNPGHALFDRGYGYGGQYIPTREWGWPPPPTEEINRILHNDSLRAATFAQIAMLQGYQDIGMEYKNENKDYDVSFSTGGALSDNTSIFFSISQDTDHENVPTPTPEWRRQVMTNLTYRPKDSDKFLFRFLYNKDFDHSGFWERMLFDREMSMSKIYNTSMQYGLDWTHIYSNATYLDLKFNILDLKSEEGVELLRDGEFRDDYSSSSNWTYYYGPNRSMRVGYVEDETGTENTTTYQFHGKLTSQINPAHLLKGGLKFSYYNLDVDREEDLGSRGGYNDVSFEKNPYEGALYLEDKMEFEGLVATVGMRFDFYDFNSEYYSNIYSPLKNPEYSDTSNESYYSREKAAKNKTKLKAKIEPRIGISFPVSDKTVFHLNYGTFMQRPGFNQILYNRITINKEIEEIGNARLEPQVTNSYDIGIVQNLPFGFRLNLSAYYKDVTDLIERAFYKDEQQIQYATFVNRDYADIKGFHVDIEKRGGIISGYVRYNWQSAKGKSSNAFNAPVTFYQEPDPKYGKKEIPDPEDIYLDFDRRHNIVCKLRFGTPSEAGFSIFGFKPLADIDVTGRYRIMSGRPYTWDETGKGLRMNKRTPWEYDLRARIQKSFEVNNTDCRIYLEGYNLVNQIEWDYNHTFTTGHEAYTRWHTDRKEVLTNKEWSPYVMSQEIYLLDNEPRHFEMGLIIEY